MIKRNDLAKQFELVVQQEIKNHNDAVLASNLSINEIREDLSECFNKLHKEIDKLNSQIVNDNSFISQKTAQISVNLKSIESFVNESVKINDRNCNEFKNIHSDLENIFSHSKKNASDIFNLERRMKAMEENLTDLYHQCGSDFEKNRVFFSKMIQKMKHDILNLPSEAKLIQKEIEKKIAANSIDFQGILKEIDIIKKQLFIKDKHIENLYTQIERLKDLT